MKMKIKIFIFAILSVYSCIFMAHADQQQDPALVQSMLTQYSLISPQVLADRHFFLDLAVQNNFDFDEPGLQLGFGYRKSYLGFDLRFTKGRNSYGEIRHLAFSNSWDGYSDNAEIDIARAHSDMWSHWSIGPGFSVADKFFSSFLAGFTERVRAGFAFGNYNDEKNNIPFESYIFNIETSVLYQLNPTTPWSLSASLNWNTGMLVRDYGDDTQHHSYGIPVSWLGCSMGIEYAF